jgi:hypothetical protein
MDCVFFPLDHTYEPPLGFAVSVTAVPEQTTELPSIDGFIIGFTGAGVHELGELTGHPDPRVADAAREALKRILGGPTGP